MNGQPPIMRTKKMNKDYFFFSGEKEAREFYLKALGYGIWADCAWDNDSNSHIVTIDKDKTWGAMYATSEN
jgi:hypothetical protein